MGRRVDKGGFTEGILEEQMQSTQPQKCCLQR